MNTFPSATHRGIDLLTPRFGNKSFLLLFLSLYVVNKEKPDTIAGFFNAIKMPD